TGSADPVPADESLLALARRTPDDALAVGPVDAPVVMIEYSDFQCPFCGRFARETEPELLRSYVDKGVLRIEWRNFPVFGEESERAALAGWAAGRQKKFWQFHEVAYNRPRERNKGEFAAEELVAMAREAGVTDIERFQSDMTSDAARAAVRKDQEEGYGLGVSSTPAFLINGKPVLGAQPTATFRKAVEAAAGAAGR
ncbi:DsbA family protein, partial [Streptomyces sp. NPDC056347]|uniref:DsbA family protein n=1 Tax=Streptomyces sp. NPDC056347 TaxID=3345790 RepID=UPI0035E0ADC4